MSGIWDGRAKISKVDGSVTIRQVAEIDEHQYICSFTGSRNAVVDLKIIGN